MNLALNDVTQAVKDEIQNYYENVSYLGYEKLINENVKTRRLSYSHVSARDLTGTFYNSECSERFTSLYDLERFYLVRYEELDQNSISVYSILYTDVNTNHRNKTPALVTV